MKIVIAGAGDIGFHLAKLLTSEQKDIVLIDTNEDVLEYASTHLDVLAIKGDSSSISTLNDAGVKGADLFLAVTTFENTNIVSCILAKQLGAKRAIARVSKHEFLTKEQKAVFKNLGVDRLIFPTQLAAYEIERLLQMTQVTDHFEFEGGKVVLIGITLDDNSPFVEKSLKEMNILYPQLTSRPIAILRNNETILPRSGTRLMPNDHVYFISLRAEVQKLLKIIGKKTGKIRNVMILGGEGIGKVTAKRLEKHYNVTIVDNKKECCKDLAEFLNNSLIIKGDPSNFELLKEEGLERMDALIAMTPNSETNIIACLMAEQSGIIKTIALVDNTDYTHISQNIGIDTIINKKLIAANNIFRFVRQGKIEAITSLHGVDAEIIEYILFHEGVLTENKLRDIKFPENAIICAVVRGSKSTIPTGELQLKINDRVIVLGVSDSMQALDEMFK